MATFAEKLMGNVRTNYGDNLEKAFSLIESTPQLQQLYYGDMAPDVARQNISQGLNLGNKNIADLQQQLGINVPSNPLQVEQARQGEFNQYGTTREGGLIPDLLKGYTATETGLSPTGTAQRVGNVARTIIDNPLVRAGLAYGAVSAVGGSPSQALAQGINAGVTRQNVATANQLYRKQLQDLGVDTTSISGNISANDYKAIAENFMRKQRIDLQQQIANAKDTETARKLILQGINNNIISAQDGATLLQGYGLNVANVQPSNLTRATEAKISQGERRLNLLQQKINDGRATRADKQEYNALRNEKLRLDIQKRQQELAGGGQPQRTSAPAPRQRQTTTAPASNVKTLTTASGKKITITKK